MDQEIKCRKGKCIDKNSIDSELDSVYSDKSIVNDIEKDLLKDLL